MVRRFSLMVVLFAFFAVIQMTGCISGAWGDAKIVRGSGDVEEEEHSIGSIHSVELATIGTLFIEEGRREELVIEAEDNIISHIVVEEHGSRLVIRSERGISLRPRRPIKYFLTVKRLNEVVISSAGDIVIDDLTTRRFSIEVNSAGDCEIGTLDCTDLEVSISSAGDVAIDELNAETLDVEISSAGDLKIGTGHVDEQIIAIRSAGDYHAKGLDSQRARVRVSSSGDVYIRVSEYLDARASSVGDIHYYGRPRVRSNESSVGDIRRAGR